MKSRDRGFTLIEILMVLILIAVLAAVALNSFINFKNEAKDAALRSNLAAMRSAIGAQYSQMQLRCGTASGKFPTLASIVANDVTDAYDGSDPSAITNPTVHNGCDPATEVTIVSERKFFQGGVPANPWAPTADTTPNTITACVTAGCTRGAASAKACDNTTTYTDNWCYNAATGEIWSDSDPGGTDELTDRQSW